MVVKNLIENMNYVCDFKETSGLVSDKYKLVIDDIVKLAENALSKGLISMEKFEEIIEMLPTKEMFSLEHSEDLLYSKYNALEFKKMENENAMRADYSRVA